MELKKYKLSEIIETFIPGDWGEESFSSESPHAVRCVRGADIVPIWNSDYNHIPIRYISNRSFANKQLKVGDIIIEKSGGSPTQSTGRTAFVSEELISNATNLVCTNFCTAFRIKPGWNPKYVYYYLQHLYNNDVFFNFEGKTSGLKNLQIENAFDKATITQIPIEKQNQIVEVLDTLDRKIALNRAINRNLEALAKQLYDYWFVQFDFPDENGRPYKSSGGKMVWNEDIQMSIPFGWNVCRLSDFIGKNNTGDWGTDEPSGNLIEIGCIRGADILSLNDLPKRYIKSNKVEKLLTEWDVVIEVSGGSPVQATGRSAYITPGVIERNGGNISCSNFCHAFSFKDYRDSAYFFYVWNMFYDNGIMFNYEGKTSGIKNFMTDVFLANKWINAPKTLIVKFYNVIKEIYAKMDANISENNSLVKQRDNLLPLLMNGQVEVKQLNSDLSNS